MHQDSVTANLLNLVSNPGPLLPKPVLWLKLSWEDLIIMPLIMVMLRFTLHCFQFNLTLNLFQIHTPLQSNQLMIIKWTISWNSSTQNMMMIFLILTFRFLGFTSVLPSFKMYTVSTVLFHKYGGENISVTNYMSHFSMFVPTKATVKLANRNTGHAQWIEIILCRFPTFSIIYPVGTVYYCPGRIYNTISWGALKFYVGIKNVTSEPLEHCDFVGPQGCSWRSPYQTCNNIDYLRPKISEINPHRDKDIFVPIVCWISKQTLSQLIHKRFGHVSITIIKKMARKGLMEGLP